jgi:hypothetical protein
MYLVHCQTLHHSSHYKTLPLCKSFLLLLTSFVTLMAYLDHYNTHSDLPVLHSDASVLHSDPSVLHSDGPNLHSDISVSIQISLNGFIHISDTSEWRTDVLFIHKLGHTWQIFCWALPMRNAHNWSVRQIAVPSWTGPGTVVVLGFNEQYLEIPSLTSGQWRGHWRSNFKLLNIYL